MATKFHSNVTSRVSNTCTGEEKTSPVKEGITSLKRKSFEKILLY